MQPTEITKESAKASVATLPEQEIGGEVLLEKYAKGAERTATETGSIPTEIDESFVSPLVPTLKISRLLSGVLTA